MENVGSGTFNFVSSALSCVELQLMCTTTIAIDAISMPSLASGAG